MFSKYISANASVLDIGIGSGRTSFYLANRPDYLGIDLSEEMIRSAKALFPDYQFRSADARDMNFIQDSSFDIAVFSFNGLDCLPSTDERLKVLNEIKRVLKPNGLLICSCHYTYYLLEYPEFSKVDMTRSAWRIIRAIVLSCLKLRRIITRTFWLGHGYYRDQVRGLHSLNLFYTTPRFFRHELSQAGFSLVENVPDRYPTILPFFFVRWFYYAAISNP